MKRFGLRMNTGESACRALPGLLRGRERSQGSPDRGVVAGQVATDADEVDALDSATGWGAEIEDTDAVLRRLDLGEEGTLERDQLHGGEVAHEDRVLKWLAVILGNAMDPPQPAWMPDVVRHEVPDSVGHGGSRLSSCHGTVGGDVAHKHSGE